MANDKKVISRKVINYYEVIDKDLLPEVHNPNFDLHGIKLPFRMVINAPSGTGKSNYLFHLLKLFGHKKGTFATLTIVTQNSDEPLYNQLRRSCKGINIIDGIDNMPNLDEYDKEVNNLIIFDDLVLESAAKTKMISNYYIRARKQNVSAIYLTQRYYETAKMIRTNSNYVIILRLEDEKDTKLVLSQFKGTLPRQTVLNMYEYATSEPFVPLFIDCGKKVSNRFRKDVDEVLNPDDFRNDVMDF